MKLNDLYESQVALFIHDCVSNVLPISFVKAYKFNYEIQEDQQTRQYTDNQMYIEQCNSTVARKLPLYKFPLIYWIGGVILSEMFLREAISRNNWTISYYHHWFGILIIIETYYWTVYCIIIFFFTTWPGLTIKMLLSHHPIALPLMCPGLFHSASLTVICTCI